MNHRISRHVCVWVNEVREVTNIVRRIAAILLGPALDASYLAVKANTYEWPLEGR